MELISHEILPLEKRASCTKEEALSCLEALEGDIKEKLSGNIFFKLYEGIERQIESLSQSLLTKPAIDITSEDRDFDRLLKILADMEKISRGLASTIDQMKKTGIVREKKLAEVNGTEV